MVNLTDDGLIDLSQSRVQLKPYQPRPLKPVEIISDAELLASAGGIAIVDTENYINYNSIGFKINDKYLTLETPFNPQKLSWIMHSYKTVGFNSLKYDLQMIWYAFTIAHYSIDFQLKLLKELSDALILLGTWPKQAQIDFQYKVFNTNHIDLIEVCPLRGSLKLYGARLHSPRIQELPFSMTTKLTDEEKAIVKHYNYNDLDVTELLHNNLTEQLKLRESLASEYNDQTILSKSDAQIAEKVIGNELKKITGYWPKKPDINSSTFFHKFQTPKNLFFQTDLMKRVLNQIEQISFSVGENGRLEKSEMNDIRVKINNSIYRMGTGGLHSSEECRAIKIGSYVIKDIDVESFYPAIVINQKLYPKHLGPAFTQVYTAIRDRRVDAKRNKRIAESENLKVTINGTFGKTGSPFSFLYAPEMTIQITVGGQLYLLMLIELIELSGIPIASANTDGIVALCPHSKVQELADIIKKWEFTTGFKTEETEYEAIYSRDVNAYLAVKKKEDKYTFKGKNDYYDPWRPQNAKDSYWRFQKNPTHQICVEAIEKLISQNIAIETTIKACQDITKFICVKNVKGGAHKDGEYLGKVVRWAYVKGVIGTINYIQSNNKVPETEGALPLMDLPESFPEDIDYDWYVAKCKTMLEDCGYSAKQQQIRFF